MPWDEPGFDCHKILNDLDRDWSDRGHEARPSPGGRSGYFRGDEFSEDHRRSPPFAGDQHFEHHHLPNQGQWERRRLSPPPPTMAARDRWRVSPQRGGGRHGMRGMRGMRGKGFESQGRSPHSPPRPPRELSPLMPRPPPYHRPSDPGASWRREEQDRGRDRFRDFTPGGRRSEEPGGGGAGRERARRSPLGPSRERRDPECHQERNAAFKRKRREMEEDKRHFG